MRQGGTGRHVEPDETLIVMTGDAALHSGVERVARRRRMATWAPPIVAAAAFIGPAWRDGAVLNLDLVLFRCLEVPVGVWGLGPEFPRRLPMWVLIGMFSRWIAADTLGKLVMAACIAGGWLTMMQFAQRLGVTSLLGRHAAGALYAASPFVLTRLAVGHLMVAVPHALLPAVLPVLVRPGRRLDRTFLAASAMALGGHFGGSLALAIVAVGLVFERIRSVKVVATVVAAQLPWLVPGVLVWWSARPGVTSGVPFSTAADGIGGLARLSAGGGFWNTYFQVGGAGIAEAVIGAVLVGLAIVGSRSLSSDRRWALVCLGALGWLVAAASALPGIRSIVGSVTGNPVTGVWREGQRLVGLHLAWLAPCAVLGAERLAARADLRRMAGALGLIPVAAAIALAGPGVWGLAGNVEATPVPGEWHDVRAQVHAGPGTVLALPWVQYMNLAISSGRAHRTLQPLPLFLGGDVIGSSRNGLDTGVPEWGDPREAVAAALLARLDRGEPIATDLARLGVRWVVILTGLPGRESPNLWRTPGLRLVRQGDTIALFEVEGWVGEGVTADGQPVDVTGWRALQFADNESAFEWFTPGARGWRRGWDSLSITERGTMSVPAGSGPLWNITTLPSVAAQIPLVVAGLMAVALAMGTLRRRSSCDRRPTVAESSTA